MRRKNVIFLYKTPRREVLEKSQRGNWPDTILFGANHFSKFGYRVVISDDAFSNFNPFKIVFYPVFLFLRSKTGLGFKIDQVFTLFPKLLRADVIVSTVDSAGLPALLFKKLKILNRPIIYCSVGFAEKSLEMNNYIFRFYKSLIREADAVVCYSSFEKAFLKKYNTKVFLLRVGTDVKFYQKMASRKASKKIKILAFGRDPNRDYKCFLMAVKSLKTDTSIICSPQNIKGLNVGHTKISFDVSPQILKESIQNADIIVIPVKNVKQASGQLSVLDAMASSKAIVLPRVESITKMFNIENKKDCLLYEPGNSRDLEKKIKILLEKGDLRKILAKNARRKARLYTTFKFASELKEIIDSSYEKNKFAS